MLSGLSFVHLQLILHKFLFQFKLMEDMGRNAWSYFNETNNHNKENRSKNQEMTIIYVPSNLKSPFETITIPIGEGSAMEANTEASNRLKNITVFPISQVLANQMENYTLERALSTALSSRTATNTIQKHREEVDEANVKKKQSNGALIDVGKFQLQINVGDPSSSSQELKSPVNFNIHMNEKPNDKTNCLKVTILPPKDDKLSSRQPHASVESSPIEEKPDLRRTPLIENKSVNLASQDTMPIHLRFNWGSISQRDQRNTVPSEYSVEPPNLHSTCYPPDGDKITDNDMPHLQEQANSSARCSSNQATSRTSNARHNSLKRHAQTERLSICNRRIDCANLHSVNTCGFRITKGNPLSESKPNQKEYYAANKAVENSVDCASKALPESNTYNPVALRKLDPEPTAGCQDSEQSSNDSQGGSRSDNISLQVFLDADYGSDTIPIIIDKKADIRPTTSASSSKAKMPSKDNLKKSKPGTTVMSDKPEAKKCCNGATISGRSVVKKSLKGIPLIAVSKGNSNCSSMVKDQIGYCQSNNTGTSSGSSRSPAKLYWNLSVENELNHCLPGSDQCRGSSVHSMGLDVELLDDIAEELVNTVVDAAIKAIDIEEASLRPVEFPASCGITKADSNSDGIKKRIKFILDRGENKKPIKFNLTLCLVGDENEKQYLKPKNPKDDCHFLSSNPTKLTGSDANKRLPNSLKKLSVERTEEAADLLVEDAIYSALNQFTLAPPKDINTLCNEIGKNAITARIKSLVACVNGKERAVSKDKSGAYNLTVDKEMVDGSMTLQLAFSVSSESDEISDMNKGRQSPYKNMDDLSINSKNSERTGILINLKETHDEKPMNSPHVLQDIYTIPVPTMKGETAEVEFHKAICPNEAVVDNASLHLSEYNLISTDNLDEILAKSPHFSEEFKRDSSSSLFDMMNLSLPPSELNDQLYEDRSPNNALEDRRTSYRCDANNCFKSISYESINLESLCIRADENLSRKLDQNCHEEETQQTPVSKCLKIVQTDFSIPCHNSPTSKDVSTKDAQLENHKGELSGIHQMVHHNTLLSEKRTIPCRIGSAKIWNKKSSQEFFSIRFNFHLQNEDEAVGVKPPLKLNIH